MIEQLSTVAVNANSLYRKEAVIGFGVQDMTPVFNEKHLPQYLDLKAIMLSGSAISAPH